MQTIAITINRNKNWLYISALALIVVGIFSLVMPALASTESALLTFVGWLVMPIISFLGNVLLILIEILIGIFKFTEFIDTPAVQLGWVVVRDVANMAIVVALIIIAFATVFRIQRYAASQLLVKLVIAAVLVNFSLLITGLLIDFGQVVMMTFVHAFDKLAAGNLTVGLGIEDMLKVSTQYGLNVDSADVLGAMFLAVVLLLVAIAVILVMIVVLLQRVIYLWILAIFSPMAWVAPLLPGGSSWGSKWWSNFSNQVFIGPILAFGFWLSMSVLSGLSANQSLVNLTIQNTDPNVVKSQSSQIARFVSKASTPQAIFDFMITIGLLLGTLMMAKQAGGAAGSFASSTFGKFQRAPGAIFKRATRPVTDRYQAYKGKREGIRKEKIQRFGTRLSAFKDRATIGLPDGKRRTRALARSQRDLASLAEANMKDAEQVHNLGGRTTEELENIAAGNGVGRRNVAVQQRAAQLVGEKAGGFANADSLNKARKLFSAPHLQGMLSKLDDSVKKNNEKVATESEIYRDETGTLTPEGLEKLSDDILNGTLDVRVTNNEDLRGDIQNVAPKGGYIKQLAQKARNGDHISSLISKLDNETKTTYSNDMDMSDLNLSKDKKHGLAEAGLGRRAFNLDSTSRTKAERIRDKRDYIEFSRDKRKFAKSIDNMSEDTLNNQDSISIIRKFATPRQFEQLIEDNRNKRALGKGLKKHMDDYGSRLTDRGLKGAAYRDKYYNAPAMAKSRAGLAKITNNITDSRYGYDMSNQEGQKALKEAISKGRIKGKDVKKSVIKAGSQEANFLGQNLSVAEIASLAEDNKEMAGIIVDEIRKTIEKAKPDSPLYKKMNSKLNSIEKNPRTSDL